MSARKLSISMPEDIAAQAQEMARLTGQSLSAWVTDAVFAQLGEQARIEIGRRAIEELIEEVEAESGPPTAEDQAWVADVMAKLFPEDGASSSRAAG